MEVEPVVGEQIGQCGAGFGGELCGGFHLNGAPGASLGQVDAVLDVDDGMKR